MSKHTPGPWFVDGDQTLDNGNLVGVYVANDLGGRIGQTFSNCMASDSECRANARLMAAAPKLLEALRSLTHSIEEDDLLHDDQRAAFKEAIASIKEATGEQA